MSELICSRPFVYLYILLCSVQILYFYFNSHFNLNLFFALFSISISLLIVYWNKVTIRFLLSSIALILYFFVRILIHYEALDHPPTQDQSATFHEDLKLIVEKREFKNYKIYITGTPLYKNIPGLVYLQILNTEINSTIKVKDTINCKATIAPLVNYHSRFFKTFDQYLYNNHIRYKAFSRDSNCILFKFKDFHLHRIADDLSHSCVKALAYNSNDSTASSVIRALVIGDKTELNSSTKAIFQSSGTAHVLAVSGLHLGILYFLLNFAWSHILNISRYYNTVKSIVIIILLWLFTFIVGLSPSAVRATIMISVYLLSAPFKRKNNPINTLFFCAFMMQLYDPCLATDVGFQLSVIAVLSILIFHPLFDRLLIFHTALLKYFWTSMSLTLSVQILISPISMYYFQSFPSSFILANLLWSPISFIAMSLGLISLVISSLSLSIAGLFNLLNEELIRVGISGINYLQDHQLKPISDLWLSTMECAIFYLVIFLITLSFMNNSTRLLVYGLFLFCVLGAQMIYNIHSQFARPSLVLCYEKGRIQTEFILNGICYTTIANSYELKKWRSYKTVRKIIELPEQKLISRLKKIGLELEGTKAEHRKFTYSEQSKRPLHFKTHTFTEKGVLRHPHGLNGFLSKYPATEYPVDHKLLKLRPMVLE